jgi:hypothetical protein
MAYTAIAPTYVSGYGGAVLIDATAQPITDWDGNQQVGTFDATNSTSGGNASPERTIMSMTGSFTCVWPVTAGYPPIAAGEIHILKLLVQTGSFWQFNALITGVSPKLAVNGGVTYSVTYMSKGAITVPVA